MKNFEMYFETTPIPNFGHAPKKFFAQKIRVTHQIDVEFNAEFEYEILFFIKMIFILKNVEKI